MRPDLLYVSSARLAPLVDLLRPRAVVYRIPVREEALPGAPRGARALREALARRADRIVSPCRGLVDELVAAGVRAHHLPNGVDPEPYAFEAPPRPAELSGLAPPIALFVGSIDARLDRALVAEVARRLPEVSFVLVGPERVPLGAPLRRLKRVRVLGPVAPGRVPALARHADVGLLPFRPGPWADGCAPLAVHEMAAAGLEVVATPVAEVVRLAGDGAPLRLAAGARAFAAQVEAALAERSAATAARARAFGAASAWRDGFRELLQL